MLLLLLLLLSLSSLINTRFRPTYIYNRWLQHTSREEFGSVTETSSRLGYLIDYFSSDLSQSLLLPPPSPQLEALVLVLVQVRGGEFSTQPRYSLKHLFGFAQLTKHQLRNLRLALTFFLEFGPEFSQNCLNSRFS